VLDLFERQVPPAVLGYPLTAYVTTQVAQRRPDDVAAAPASIPEVLQADGIIGQTDLLVRAVAATLATCTHPPASSTPAPHSSCANSSATASRRCHNAWHRSRASSPDEVMTAHGYHRRLPPASALIGLVGR